MLIGQVIELDPTAEQRIIFARNASAARIARNDLICLWREEGKRLKGFRYKLVELRPVCNSSKFKEHPWFKDVSQRAIKGGFIDAEDAIKRCYSKQNKKPKLLKKGARRRFRADNGVGTVVLENKLLTLPRKAGGVIKCKEALRWSDRPIRECRIKERAGRWYASVRVEISESEYDKVAGEGVVGVDLGMTTFATIAYPDNTLDKVQAPEPHKKALKRLRLAQRRVSRRKKGGANRKKAQHKCQRAYARMANVRKDFLHKLSDKLTSEAYAIVIESLSLKAWQKQWGRKASDLAPAEWLRQLRYKSEWKNGLIIEAPRNYPSTQICSACNIRGSKLGLSIRSWACKHCGVLHDRDENAAVNLWNYGRELLGYCPRTECKTDVMSAIPVEVGTESYEISAYLLRLS